jgi:hypothetical protein
MLREALWAVAVAVREPIPPFGLGSPEEGLEPKVRTERIVWSTYEHTIWIESAFT